MDIKAHIIVIAHVLSYTVASPDTVFVTLFRTAVETATSGVHKWLHTGGSHLLDIVGLAVADGLFGLYGSEAMM